MMREMRKYYLGLGVLSVIVAAMVVLNVFGSVRQKADYALEKKVTNANTSIETFISSKRRLPASLNEVSVNENEGVDYKKISEKRYLLCATYRTKSDGFAAAPEVVTSEIRSESLSSGVNLASDAAITDATTDGGGKHDKGYSCAAYKPYQLSEEQLKPYVPCSWKKEVNRYEMQSDFQILSRIDTVKRQLTYQQASDQNYRVTNPPLPSTLGYGNDVIVYDYNCNLLTIKDLQISDKVVLFTPRDYSTIQVVQRFN